MHKFVWDTSAIVNIKESNDDGYSPGRSLFKDLSDGWIDIDYQNIFPTLAVFEVNATVSKLARKGKPVLREFYLLDDRALMYDVDQELIRKANQLFTLDGFDKLYGADLVFACIAKIEDAYLVTMDRKLAMHASKHVKVIDLNES
ncbi:hypothetical protein P7L89_25590, partial [Vibrio parahaemolyticus]|nr:hypothetical protein [Vibrio parahaemolyticus]